MCWPSPNKTADTIIASASNTPRPRPTRVKSVQGTFTTTNATPITPIPPTITATAAIVQNQSNNKNKTHNLSRVISGFGEKHREKQKEKKVLSKVGYGVRCTKANVLRGLERQVVEEVLGGGGGGSGGAMGGGGGDTGSSARGSRGGARGRNRSRMERVGAWVQCNEGEDEGVVVKDGEGRKT